MFLTFAIQPINLNFQRAPNHSFSCLSSCKLSVFTFLWVSLNLLPLTYTSNNILLIYTWNCINCCIYHYCMYTVYSVTVM